MRLRVRHSITLLALLCTVLPVAAPHSMSALFDINQRFSRTGTLTDLDWRNPHIYLLVESREVDGQMQTWAFEGPSPVIYVSPFDPSQPDGRADGATPVRVTNEDIQGMIAWRGDDKEMYYLSKDWEVMAMDVITTPVFAADTPKLLFKLPGPLRGNPRQMKSVTNDGQCFVFVISSPASLTQPL